MAAWRNVFFRWRRRSASALRTSVHGGADAPDYFEPQRRVAGSSSGRKAMDATRGRLVFMALVFAVVFAAIGFRVLDVALGGKLGGSEAQAALSDPEHGEADAAALENTAPEPEPEKPGMMDALLGTEGAVTDDEALASIDATNNAARPKRGDITDRNGIVVAASVQTQSLYADAKVIRQFDVPQVVKRIHAAFPDLNAEVMEKRIQKGKRFVYLKRHLTPQEQDATVALGIPGLSFQPDARRVYPQGQLLGHVLGYVDIDNHGIAGVEKKLDARLNDPNQNGKPLALSIDLRVQHILREEMLKAMGEFQAIGAAGVIMDIDSGQLLAMSSLPDFDPNMPGHATDDARFNRASLGVYEMGSTFKTFSMAAAIEYKTSTMEQTYDVAPIHIGRFTIKDAHPENHALTLPEVYAYSSNIGTVHIINGVGPARQHDFLKSLGLLAPLDVELPERGRPQYPNPWSQISMMTIAYGHGMSVTPLHLVRAIASLTGGGTLRDITLLRDKPKGASNTHLRIVSEETSRKIRDLMRLVVQYGTASKADAPGYEVGGKTGTAEKVEKGGYAHNDKMASFVGVFPISDPKYVVLVMLDTPRGNKSTYGFATGGWVSAPVVGRVVARIGPLLGMKPNMQAANIPGEAWLENARAKLIAAKAH